MDKEEIDFYIKQKIEERLTIIDELSCNIHRELNELLSSIHSISYLKYINEKIKQ